MNANRSIDELESALQEMPPSTDYIDALNQLSHLLIRDGHDLDRALRLLDEAQTLYKNQFPSYRKGLAEALINRSRYFQQRVDIGEALHCVMKAGEICQELGDVDLTLWHHDTLQFIYQLSADWNNALKVSIDSLRIVQEHCRREAEARALTSVARVYTRLGEYSQAVAYYERALAIVTELNNDYFCAIVHLNMTYPHRCLGNYEQALNHAATAYSFLRGNMSENEAVVLGIFGHIYTEMEAYEQAMDYHKRKLAMVETMDSNYLRAFTHSDIGAVHLAIGHTLEGIKWLESGVQLAKLQQMTEALLPFYEPLVQAYKANQNYDKALMTFEKLAALCAELQSTAAVNQRNTLLVIHETEQAQFETMFQQERADILRTQAENLAKKNALMQKIDKLKKDLVATASHDMRNPLTAINMDLLLLKRMAEGMPKAQRYVERLLNSTEHVTDLISDLLDFSNIKEAQRPKMALWDLTNLVQEAVLRHKALARAKTIELKLALPGDPVQLELDAHRFGRVLDSLISNAIKYTGDGGKVFVTLDKAIMDKANDCACLRVRDSGRGIPADEIAHIFDSRFRASNSGGEEGSGHGLAIVKSIDDSHHGTVVCESTLEKGTTFTVSLLYPEQNISPVQTLCS